MTHFKPRPKERRGPSFQTMAPVGPIRETGRAKDASGRAGPAETRTVRREPLQVCWRVKTVARYLDVSRKRIYQMIREGKLDAVSVGPRGIRVLVSSIDRFLECERIGGCD